MSPADMISPPNAGGEISSIWSFGSLPPTGGVPEDIVALHGSGLFDAAQYAAAHPRLPAGADPLLHYVREGWRQGRRPNPYFDPAWYIAEHLDVRGRETEPLLHYLRYGEQEGRRPILYFDPVWYRATYRIPAGENCLRHFLAHRHTGTVSPVPEFDSGWYLRSYPDVARVGMDPLEHYLVQGFREVRNPSPHFDAAYYKRRYLADAPDENPLLHYLRHRRERPDLRLSRPPDETSIAREIRRNTRPGPGFERVRPLPPGAPRRATVLAYYLPQFHPIAENDAWWGPGFTDWNSLQRGVPRFAGHYQPRVPGTLGHYRLDGTDTLHRQVALAKGAGLSGFVFYFYWFDGHRLLERPLEAFLADRSLDFPFCLMWANENWTRRWDGADQEVLIRQHYREEDEPALVATFARHFADPRYIRLAGRPLLMVYRPGAIPDAAARLRRWRLAFRDLHDEDPIFVMSQSFGDADPTRFGMDGAIEFPPHKLVEHARLINSSLTLLDDEFSAQVYDYGEIATRATASPPPPFPLIPTVMPGWDNDPRRQGGGLVIHGATPDRYQAWLERTIARARDEPFFGTPLVCVNAWNEWAEGAYLEPDVHFGAAFLNATGRAIAGVAGAAADGRLLLIGHDAFPAGSQRLLLHLGRVLSRRHGMRIEFLLRDGGVLLPDYEAVAPVRVVPDDAALDRVLADRHAAGVRAAIVNTSVAAPICTRLAGIGIAAILLVHELPGLLRERGLAAAAAAGAAAAARVVFAADVVRDRFLAETGLPPDRTSVHPQGLYAEADYSAAAREQGRLALGLAPQDVLAIGVGYADLRKGFDLFLQVWRTARRRDGNLQLLWVGDIDPTMRSYLAAEMALAGDTGTFHFAGRRDDVAALLSAADVMLLPSREDPYPSSALEALGTGLPVIAFEGSGGVPALLRRHAAGQVVPMADAGAMAACLIEIARSLRRMAPAARRRAAAAAAIRHEHDFPAYAATLLRLARPALRTVSVVVPSYNYARFLPARLASVFAQTYPVHEVIVLDDASQDDSVRVARETAAGWSRDIEVIARDRNTGSVFRQWADGAARAHGEFVWIAEADDSSEPGFLDHMVRAMAESEHTAMACCDSRCIDAEGRPLRASYGDYYAESAGPGALAEDDVFQGVGFARRFLSERNLIMNVSGVLWRRAALLAALERCGGELARYRVAGDWRLYLELLAHGTARVAWVAAPLNIHRRHEVSATRATDWRAHVDEIEAMHEVVARRLGLDAPSRARQRLYVEALRARPSRPLEDGPPQDGPTANGPRRGGGRMRLREATRSSRRGRLA